MPRRLSFCCSPQLTYHSGLVATPTAKGPDSGCGGGPVTFSAGLRASLSPAQAREKIGARSTLGSLGRRGRRISRAYRSNWASRRDEPFVGLLSPASNWKGSFFDRPPKIDLLAISSTGPP